MAAAATSYLACMAFRIMLITGLTVSGISRCGALTCAWAASGP